MKTPSTTVKGAEITSSLGAIVLGAGLALLAPQVLQAHGPALLVAGLVIHGAGMTLKYRLENRADPAVWWERTLFWLCWACLAVLAGWLLVRTLAG